jgi:hypothetical protein
MLSQVTANGRGREFSSCVFYCSQDHPKQPLTVTDHEAQNETHEHQQGADSVAGGHGSVSNRLTRSSLPSSLSDEKPMIDEHQAVQGHGKRQRRDTPTDCELEHGQGQAALMTVRAKAVS